MFSIGFGEAIILSLVCMVTVAPVVVVAAIVLTRKKREQGQPPR